MSSDLSNYNLKLIQLKNLLIFGERKVLKQDCSDIHKLIKSTQTQDIKRYIQQTVYTTDSQDILNNDCFFKFEDFVTVQNPDIKLIIDLIKMDEDKLDNSINSIDSIKNFYNIKYPYLKDFINLNDKYNKILTDEYQNILDKLTNARISKGDISYDYITYIYKSDLEKIKSSGEDRQYLPTLDPNYILKLNRYVEEDTKIVEYYKQLRKGSFPINDDLTYSEILVIQKGLNKISENSVNKLTDIYTLYKNDDEIPDILLSLLYNLWSNKSSNPDADYNYIFDSDNQNLPNMIKSYTKVFNKLKHKYSNSNIKWIGKEEYDTIFTRISLIIEKENND